MAKRLVPHLFSQRSLQKKLLKKLFFFFDSLAHEQHQLEQQLLSCVALVPLPASDDDVARDAQFDDAALDDTRQFVANQVVVVVVVVSFSLVDWKGFIIV